MTGLPAPPPTPTGRTALVAEFAGSAWLLAVVVGSGIMGQRLAGGNDAIALLANALATGAGLTVLIHALGRVSGAHFNPLVTLLATARGELPPGLAAGYVVAQFAGAVTGVTVTHLMFALPAVQVATTPRSGPGLWLAELVATTGLLATIRLVGQSRPEAVPACVGLYILSAYWFTASTSFANPAVTLARAFTDSFAGIAPASVPGFWLAQAAGLVLSLVWLRRRP